MQSRGFCTQSFFITSLTTGVISGKIAKDLLPSLLQGAANAKGVRQLVTEQGMTMVTDEAEVAALVEQVWPGASRGVWVS